VYYSDLEAIRLAESNSELRSAIIDEFGKSSYDEWRYDRRYVANIVFYDKKYLDKINAIFAPFLAKDFELFAEKSQVTFYESALVYEHNLSGMFDKVIATWAPIPIITERLRLRNALSDEEISRRLKNQMDPLEKATNADCMIVTHEDPYEICLEERVKSVINLFNIQLTAK
jgi:dephospho-CoA kinase